MDEVKLRASTGRTQRGVWREAPEGSRRAAVVFPGVRYTPAHPLLYFTTRVLRTSGFDVLEVWYDYSDVDLGSLDPAELGELAGADAEAAIAELDAQRTGGRRLVVGKSLGTVHLAALSAGGHMADAASVWLTPLLALDAVSDAISRRVHPTLVLTGTDDPATPPEALADLEAFTDPTVKVMRIQGGDHALERPAPRDAVAALDEVVSALASFVTGLARG